jgi:DNA-binding CsgD family transcriptional regulator
MASLQPSFAVLDHGESAPPTLALLERLAIPIAIVSPFRQLVWTNSGCLRFIAEAGQLRLDGRRLCPVAQEQAGAFAAFIAGKQDGSRGRLGRDVFLLRTGDGEDGALLMRLATSPNPDHATDGQAGADQIIGIFDLKGPSARQNDVARQLYGLTPAEHMLCVSIAAGDDLKSWARKRQVSLHTVRAQLRSVLRKMNATRQQDIVRIWLGLGVINSAPAVAAE